MTRLCNCPVLLSGKFEYSDSLRIHRYHGGEHMNKTIEFIESGGSDADKLDSFILEAYIENEEIAELLCIEGKWLVRLRVGNNLMTLTWANFVALFARFASFVADETAPMLNEARGGEKRPRADEDAL